ncbi:MAG: Ribosomal protein S9 [Parcubacteria group bacterium GW2011_GWA2_42_14]|nr:MAG: Ribosomal protein S9 [Parcubacteria group bacterium GW2011_GWA2_42_14]
MIKKADTKEKKAKTVAKKAVKEKELKKESAVKKPVVEVSVKEVIKPVKAVDDNSSFVSATGGKTAEVQEKRVEAKKKTIEKKPEEKKEPVSDKTLEIAPKPDRYWEAVGRRKTAIARVRLFTKGDKVLVVNGKPYDVYFQDLAHRAVVEDALKKMKSLERFRMSAKVQGGGIHAQAEAIRHGISRALTKFNPDFKKRLRRAGYLTRDPRMKERKKFGLKKARRAPQWAKR